MPCPDMSGRCPTNCTTCKHFTGVITTGIYCCKGCPATPLRRNTLPFGHAAAGGGRGVPPVPALPPGSAARSRLDRRARARVPRHAQHRRRRARRRDRGRPRRTSRRERAPLAPALRGAHRRNPQRSCPFSPRALRAPAPRRHGSADDADRDRGRFQHCAPDEPRHAGDLPVHAERAAGEAASSPTGSWSTAGSSCASRTARRSRGASCSTFLAPRAIPGVEAVDLDAGVYRRVSDIEGAPGVIEVWDVPREQALRLRVHLPAIDGPRASRRRRAPPVRSRRRPEGDRPPLGA